MGTQAAVQRKMDNDNKFAQDIANQQAVMDRTMGEFVGKFDPFVDGFSSKNAWTGFKILGQAQRGSQFAGDSKL